MTEQIRLKYENARESLYRAIRENADTELVTRLRQEYSICSDEYHKSIINSTSIEINRFLIESTFEDFL